VNSNLHLMSHRGKEYKHQPHKHWDVDLKSLELELCLATLNIDVDEVGTLSCYS
jgi:hypothetical protein